MSATRRATAFTLGFFALLASIPATAFVAEHLAVLIFSPPYHDYSPILVTWMLLEGLVVLLIVVIVWRNIREMPN